jgi:hypothetical protein
MSSRQAEERRRAACLSRRAPIDSLRARVARRRSRLERRCALDRGRAVAAEYEGEQLVVGEGVGAEAEEALAGGLGGDGFHVSYVGTRCHA